MAQPHSLYLKLIKHLHFIYLIYAIPLVLLAALLTPPYQVPDEEHHFMRAEQVSRLEFVAHFITDPISASAIKEPKNDSSTVLFPEPGGYKVNSGIPLSGSYFRQIYYHANVKVDKLKMNEANKIKWSTSTTLWNFGNTAIYCPVPYIMPAVGIEIGKKLDWPVIKTLYLARILNGILCIMLCFWALRLSKVTNILMFIVLLMPMTVSLFGSASQDAILISCCFLLVGIIDNVQLQGIQKYLNWKLFAIGTLITIIGLSKLPYIIFILIVFFLNISLRKKLLLSGLPVLIVFLWLFIDRNTLSVIWAPPELHINAKLQVLHMLQHPIRYIGLFFKVDFRAIFNNLRMFIGILGWEDLWFPQFYYGCAFVILIIGFTMSGRFKLIDNVKIRIAALVGAFLMLIAIMTVQYITWTALDNKTLDGMQGRYLLPIFPLLALGFGYQVKEKNLTPLKTTLSYLILWFPILTIVMLIEGIISRYY